MDLHLIQDQDEKVHIHELVDTDLVHIDSPPRCDANQRVKDYLEECGTDPADVETTEFIEKNQVLSLVSTAVDAFGINEHTQNDIIAELKAYLRLPE